MRAQCEQGARDGDPLAQVALAIYLLDGVAPTGDAQADLAAQAAQAAQAERLLRSAAAKGYDDAFYWLGSMQKDKKIGLHYLEQARGSSGMGLFALSTAADMYFKGNGVPANFNKARALHKRAVEAVIDNARRGMPKPPGTWWENAKWLPAMQIILINSERYGITTGYVDGKLVLKHIAPHPALTDKELSNRAWERIDEKK
jgi:hypothetical protein